MQQAIFDHGNTTVDSTRMIMTLASNLLLIIVTCSSNV
jgi:hypothetical protein